MHEPALSLVSSAFIGGLLGGIAGLLCGILFGVGRIALNQEKRLHEQRVIEQIGWKAAIRRALFEERDLDDVDEPELPFPHSAAHR